MCEKFRLFFCYHLLKIKNNLLSQKVLCIFEQRTYSHRYKLSELLTVTYSPFEFCDRSDECIDFILQRRIVFVCVLNTISK